MSKKKSRLLNAGAFLFGMGMLAILVRSIGWDEVVRHFNLMGWAFAWLFVIHIFNLTMEVTAWRVLIRKPVSFFRLLLAANSGNAINVLTPSGDGGEFIKGNLVKEQIGGAEATSSLLLWNFLYALASKSIMLSGPVIILLWWLFDGTAPISMKLALTFLGAGLITFTYVPLLFFLVRRYGAEGAARLVHRLPILRRRDPSGLIAFARQVDDAFREFAGRYRTRFVTAVVLLLVARLGVVYEIYFVVNRLGMDTSFGFAVFLFSGSTLLTTVVSFFPTQLGVTEAGSMGLFHIMGLNPVVGFSQEFIRRLRRMVFNIIGLIYLGYRSFASEP